MTKYLLLIPLIALTLLLSGCSSGIQEHEDIDGWRWNGNGYVPTEETKEYPNEEKSEIEVYTNIYQDFYYYDWNKCSKSGVFDKTTSTIIDCGIVYCNFKKCPRNVDLYYTKTREKVN